MKRRALRGKVKAVAPGKDSFEWEFELTRTTFKARKRCVPNRRPSKWLRSVALAFVGATVDALVAWALSS